MPIPAHCPSCGAEFLLDDALAGKYVCCRDCQNNFQVPAETALVPYREERSSGAGRDRDRDRDPDDRDRSRRRREDDRPRSRRRERSEPDNTGAILLWTFGIIGGVLFLVVGVCAGTIYYVTTSAFRAADKAINQAADRRPPVFAEGPDPIDLADALNMLRAQDPARRRQAARWLARQPIDQGRRADVLVALRLATRDQDAGVQQEARQALVRWER